MATEIAVLLLGGLQLILGPGVFTVFDLHEMDMPLSWKGLTRVTDLGKKERNIYACRSAACIKERAPHR
eukprot:1161112-Pelagomonas_calceolata.AAC.21